MDRHFDSGSAWRVVVSARMEETMTIKSVTVAGSGVLGSQIAFQSAFNGYPVIVYEVSQESLEQGRRRIHELLPRYQHDFNVGQDELDEAIGRLSFTTDLSIAARDADLVIDAVPEVLSIKEDFYRRLAPLAPERTIFATNSSTLIPSQMVESTGRPDRFLALHFANEIWKHNTAEIMRHKGTSDDAFQAVVEFAKSIGMVALPLDKEQPGYILNSLLVPFLDAAQKLWFHGVADVETIDKTWMIATGAPQGPFGILDVVGLNTVYNIAMARAESSKRPEYQAIAERIKREYIDQGKLGRLTGEGFYTYPHPRFRDPDFTRG